MGSNGSFTANVPRDVDSRHTWPTSPRATGPESVAASPREKRAAISAASPTSSIVGA